MFHTISLRDLLAKLVFFILMLLAVMITLFFMTATEEESSPGISQEISGTTLIIDAGHGGEDGGAQSVTGTLESDINFDIAVKLDALAGLWGVPTVMTRESRGIDYPDSAKSTRARKSYDQNTRIDLINSVENGVLISIHQNIYPSAGPSGSQVLYAKTDGSTELGCITHENLVRTLNPENRRVPAPISNTIFLMKHAKCTAILIECGFISNPEESRLLETNDYQLKIAAVLLASYLQYENGDGNEV